LDSVSFCPVRAFSFRLPALGFLGRFAFSFLIPFYQPFFPQVAPLHFRPSEPSVWSLPMSLYFFFLFSYPLFFCILDSSVCHLPIQIFYFKPVLDRGPCPRFSPMGWWAPEIFCTFSRLDVPHSSEFRTFPEGFPGLCSGRLFYRGSRGFWV